VFIFGSSCFRNGAQVVLPLTSDAVYQSIWFDSGTGSFGLPLKRTERC